LTSTIESAGGSFPEAGENPARPRHCERPEHVSERLLHATGRFALGKAGKAASSQET
jgi:hypothetical protein